MFPDPKYIITLNRAILKAQERFLLKKKRGCHGWDDKYWKGNMASRAYPKLQKLARGESTEPLKDAADIINYAVFFLAQHKEGAIK